MAHASRKKFGAGQQDQGKGDASGGMTPDLVDNLPDNMVLSNRDTSRHSDQRGLDGRHVQNQQHQDHVASRSDTDADDLPDTRPRDATERDEP
ncbi:hypothetical protein JWJ88_05740 [Paracoccus methylovorus]|uniref:Uncharacterized protein n=1 Tax=Paracoccus methylovorus TaxID=2812658 RepID=A0ABX7JEJ6_9RHOB|nr:MULTISPECIES: hypothetical protein [Paracoccus]QRZ12149.1 hypothetical protein JWJ88_05740 [Paracoccus methylovorus]